MEAKRGKVGSQTLIGQLAWIPLTFRAPRPGAEVLALNGGEKVLAHTTEVITGKDSSLNFYGRVGRRRSALLTNVTHWLPIPATPGEIEERKNWLKGGRHGKR